MKLWPVLVLLNIIALIVFDPDTGMILIGFTVLLVIAWILLDKVIGKKPSS